VTPPRRAVQATTMSTQVDVVVKSGWLVKLPPPGVGKGKKNRFFVLFKNRLDYYADPKSMDGKPKGRILVSDIISVAEGSGGKNDSSTLFSIDCQRRRYELVAPSPMDMAAWVNKLTAVVNPAQPPPVRTMETTRVRKAASLPEQLTPGPRQPVQHPIRISAVPGSRQLPGERSSVHEVRGAGGQPRAASQRGSASSSRTRQGETRASAHRRGPASLPPEEPCGVYASESESRRRHSPKQRRSTPTFPWLFDAISREKTEDLLGPYKNTYNGVFLVRKSARYRDTHVISLTWDASVKHFLATKTKRGTYDINKRSTTLTKLPDLVADLKRSQSRWRMPLAAYVDRQAGKVTRPIPPSARIDVQSKLPRRGTQDSSASRGSRQSYDISTSVVSGDEGNLQTNTAQSDMQDEEEEAIGSFVVVESYSANGDDKLSITIGEVVQVFKIEAGWAMATNLLKMEEGWVPADFLEPVEAAAAPVAQEPVSSQSTLGVPSAPRQRTATEAGAIVAEVAGSTMLATSATAVDGGAADEPLGGTVDTIGNEVLSDDKVARMSVAGEDALLAAGTADDDRMPPAEGCGADETMIDATPPPRLPKMTGTVHVGESSTDDTPPARPPKLSLTAPAELSTDDTPPARPPKLSLNAPAESSTDDTPPARPPKLSLTAPAELSTDDTPPARPPKLSLNAPAESSTDDTPPARPPKLSLTAAAESSTDDTPPARPLKVNLNAPTESSTDDMPPTLPPKLSSDAPAESAADNTPPSRPPKTPSDASAELPTDEMPPPRAPKSASVEDDAVRGERGMDAPRDEIGALVGEDPEAEMPTALASADDVDGSAAAYDSGDELIGADDDSGEAVAMPVAVPPQRPAKEPALTAPPRPPKDTQLNSVAPPPRPAKDDPALFPRDAAGDDGLIEPTYADVGTVFAPVEKAGVAKLGASAYVMMNPRTLRGNGRPGSASTNSRNPIDREGPEMELNPGYDAYSSDDSEDDLDLPLPPPAGGSRVVFESEADDDYVETEDLPVHSGASKRGGLFNRRTKRRDRKPPRTPPSQRSTRHDGVPVREMSGPDRIRLMLMVKDGSLTQEQAVKHAEDYELGKLDDPVPTVAPPPAPEQEPLQVASSDAGGDVDALLDELDDMQSIRGSRALSE